MWTCGEIYGTLQFTFLFHMHFRERKRGKKIRIQLRLLLEVKQPPPDSYRHYKIGYMRKSFKQSPLFDTTVGGEWGLAQREIQLFCFCVFFIISKI